MHHAKLKHSCAFHHTSRSAAHACGLEFLSGEHLHQVSSGDSASVAWCARVACTAVTMDRGASHTGALSDCLWLLLQQSLAPHGHAISIQDADGPLAPVKSWESVVDAIDRHNRLAPLDDARRAIAAEFLDWRTTCLWGMARAALRYVYTAFALSIMSDVAELPILTLQRDAVVEWSRALTRHGLQQRAHGRYRGQVVWFGWLAFELDQLIGWLATPQQSRLCQWTQKVVSRAIDTAERRRATACTLCDPSSTRVGTKWPALTSGCRCVPLIATDRDFVTDPSVLSGDAPDVRRHYLGASRVLRPALKTKSALEPKRTKCFTRDDLVAWQVPMSHKRKRADLISSVDAPSPIHQEPPTVQAPPKARQPPITGERSAAQTVPMAQARPVSQVQCPSAHHTTQEIRTASSSPSTAHIDHNTNGTWRQGVFTLDSCGHLQRQNGIVAHATAVPLLLSQPHLLPWCPVSSELTPLASPSLNPVSKVLEAAPLPLPQCEHISTRLAPPLPSLSQGLQSTDINTMKTAHQSADVDDSVQRLQEAHITLGAILSAHGQPSDDPTPSIFAMCEHSATTAEWYDLAGNALADDWEYTECLVGSL